MVDQRSRTNRKKRSQSRSQQEKPLKSNKSSISSSVQKGKSLKSNRSSISSSAEKGKSLKSNRSSTSSSAERGKPLKSNKSDTSSTVRKEKKSLKSKKSTTSSAVRRAARRGTKTAVGRKPAREKPTRRRAASTAVRRERYESKGRIHDEGNVANIFQKVISELMVQKDRRTSMQYIRLTSSPLKDDDDSARSEKSQESSILKATRPLFGDAKSGKSKTDKNNNWAPLHRGAAPSKTSLSLSKSSRSTSSTFVASRPSLVQEGIFLRGSEYAKWQRDHAPKAHLGTDGPVASAVVPRDVQRNPEISGVFKSQLVQYQSKKKKAADEKQRLGKYLERQRTASGNEDSGWGSPIPHAKRDIMINVPSPKSPVQLAARPTPRMRSSGFAVTAGKSTCLERLDAISGQRFGISQSMKKLGVAPPPPQSPSSKDRKRASSVPTSPIARTIPSRPPQSLFVAAQPPRSPSSKDKKKSSSIPRSSQLPNQLLTPRPLPLSFSPSSYTTPLPGKVRPEMRRATSESGIPPSATSCQPPVRATKSAFQSSSVFRTPPPSKHPTWLVEAAKSMERAQQEGKTAVLSTSLPRGRRSSSSSKAVRSTPSLVSTSTARSSSLPRSGRLRSGSSSNSEESSAPLSDVEMNEEERKKFLHHKNIRLRLMIDHEKAIVADYSLNFESSKANPTFKITELLVDNNPVWKKGMNNSTRSSLQSDGHGPLSSHSSTSSSDMSANVVGVGRGTPLRSTSPVTATGRSVTPNRKSFLMNTPSTSQYQTPPSS